MDDSLYREILMEYWEYPKNYGVMKNADIDVTKLNPLCGDKVRIMAKVKKGRIEEISFTCKSCVVAKALASHLTLIAKGMKVADFAKMKPEKFLETLEIAFSPVRMKCALLGFLTLKSALDRKKTKKSSKP
jgi:nitrogen fixation protein NifU and related proteins